MSLISHAVDSSLLAAAALEIIPVTIIVKTINEAPVKGWELIKYMREIRKAIKSDTVLIKVYNTRARRRKAVRSRLTRLTNARSNFNCVLLSREEPLSVMQIWRLLFFYHIFNLRR